LRNDVRQFINLPIRSAEGNLILTLGQLGKFEELPRLNLIFHENGFRRRAVMVNIEGRDLDSFGQIAKDAIRLWPAYTQLMPRHSKGTYASRV